MVPLAVTSPLIAHPTLQSVIRSPAGWEKIAPQVELVHLLPRHPWGKECASFSAEPSVCSGLKDMASLMQMHSPCPAKTLLAVQSGELSGMLNPRGRITFPSQDPDRPSPKAVRASQMGKYSPFSPETQSCFLYQQVLIQIPRGHSRIWKLQ